MANLAYRTYNIESIKNEFLNIGFSEEAIDFVFLHNENYNFEVLKEKIIDVEKNLRKDISNLDIKIDSVKNELIAKIDNVEKSLNQKLSMGNRLVYFMIITAAILGPILNALFIKYLQGGK
ncbi:KID repeat family protein (plasmid) [Borreliella bissettiae DN127]|uniref:KID repeat family protein n=1 Tax=Borrelia bissettiae (strain DSM 17990 / CIP 109136 / DN127) TaxID=521010 RepID=G0AMZ2_BORBD|nr:Bdr family repetitive protein [Borreliella bissettiae]AEL19068.1 KID repeat family protein [Borreliella bissettiae DN127]